MLHGLVGKFPDLQDPDRSNTCKHFVFVSPGTGGSLDAHSGCKVSRTGHAFTGHLAILEFFFKENPISVTLQKPINKKETLKVKEIRKRQRSEHLIG